MAVHAVAARNVRLDPIRTIAVLGLVVTAAVHVPVATDHLDAARYLLVSFDLLVLVSAVLAASLAVRPNRLTALASLLVAAAAITAYVVSRTVGLPLEDDDIGDWSNTLGLVALAAELAVVVASVALLRRRS